MGRLGFSVVLNETTLPLQANLIAGYTTTLKINETDSGFFYQG